MDTKLTKKKSKMNKIATQIKRLNQLNLLEDFNFETEKQCITERIMEHGTTELKNINEAFKRNIETRKTVVKSKKESRYIRTAEAKKYKKTAKQGSKKSNAFTNMENKTFHKASHSTNKRRYNPNGRNYTMHSIKQKIFGDNSIRKTISNFNVSQLESEKMSILQENKNHLNNQTKLRVKDCSMISISKTHKFESPYKESYKAVKLYPKGHMKSPSENISRIISFTPSKKDLFGSKKQIEVNLFRNGEYKR